MKFKPLLIKKPIISFKAIFTSLMLVTLLSGCTETSVPVEGVQYKRLPGIISSNKFSPVTEVFSLTCGHCREMEDTIPGLQRSLRQNITKMHIAFNQSAYMAAMFYYAAEMQTEGIPDYKFMLDLFETMQMPKNTSEEQQRAAMINVFESRGLTSPINYNDEQFDTLSKRVDEIARLSDQTQIQSVPTFIVRGKYQVLSSAHRDREELANTIKYLLAKQ